MKCVKEQTTTRSTMVLPNPSTLEYPFPLCWSNQPTPVLVGNWKRRHWLLSWFLLVHKTQAQSIPKNEKWRADHCFFDPYSMICTSLGLVATDVRQSQVTSWPLTQAEDLLIKVWRVNGPPPKVANCPSVNPSGDGFWPTLLINYYGSAWKLGLLSTFWQDQEWPII